MTKDNSVPAWLRSHQEKLDKELAELDRRRAEVERRRGFIEHLIDDWRIHVSEDNTQPPEAPDDLDIDVLRGRAVGLSPADAIELMLQDAPGRFDRSGLADLLEEVVDSDANKPRVVIYNAIRRKISNGEIVEDSNGALYAADHPMAKQVASEDFDLPF